ncbi:MAG: hypothetical protein P8R42_23270 [Candidatus Binatia bacterium]|nr:hypothetical protein [Candidatus Binatia bacterium]
MPKSSNRVFTEDELAIAATRSVDALADALATGDRAGALGKVMQSGMLGDAGFRERAEMLMHFTRVHLQPFELQEDDEKLTFLCSVCPSAGRLLQAGRYEGDSADLPVQGPRPLTYDPPELPAYCCHEPVMEKASIRDTGAPLFIVDPSERLGEEPCRT